MKIAFINTLYFPNEIGGAENSVRLIAEQHVREGGEAIVLTLSEDQTFKKRDVNGVTVYYLPVANLGFLHGKKQLPAWKRKAWHLIDVYNPVMARRIKNVLQQERPDLVETNNLQGFSVAVWKAARKLNIPVVQVLRDYYLCCANSSMYRDEKSCDGQCGRCKLFCAPKRSLSHIPEAVISVSRRSYDLMCENGMFCDKDVFVRPSGIDATQIPEMGNIRAAGEKLSIGFLGRLTDVKGVRLLLDAVAGLDQDNVELLIAGADDTPYAQELKAIYNKPNIKFLGRTFPADLFKKIHFLFVPSVWEEPFGKVIAEAMASGTPVAVSSMGGMPENVVDGVTGFVFAPEVDAIAALIKNLHAQNLPSAEQIAACRKAAEFYDHSAVYKTHHDVWAKTISAR